jgi:hypothetical protein
MAPNVEQLVQGTKFVARQAITSTAPPVFTSTNGAVVHGIWGPIPGEIIGLIVGGSVGGFLFLVFIGMLVFWIRRRKAARARAANKVHEEEFSSQVELVPTAQSGNVAVAGGR